MGPRKFSDFPDFGELIFPSTMTLVIELLPKPIKKRFQRYTCLEKGVERKKTPLFAREFDPFLARFIGHHDGK